MPSDHWTGPITCVHCGTAHTELDISTRITDDPMVRYMRVGTRLELAEDDVVLKYYLPLHPALGRNEIRILEAWFCRPCGQYRWAQVLVVADVFSAFHAVRLTPEVLDGADLIAVGELGDVFSDWTGVTLFPDNDWRKPPRPDWLALLRAYLSEHPQ